MKYNIQAFNVEWKRAAWPMRYFLSAHLAANALIVAGAAASLIAGLSGHGNLQLSMLCAAALGALQAALTWSTLQRRFKARYSLW